MTIIELTKKACFENISLIRHDAHCDSVLPDGSLSHPLWLSDDQFNYFFHRN